MCARSLRGCRATQPPQQHTCEKNSSCTRNSRQCGRLRSYVLVRVNIFVAFHRQADVDSIVHPPDPECQRRLPFRDMLSPHVARLRNVAPAIVARGVHLEEVTAATLASGTSMVTTTTEVKCHERGKDEMVAEASIQRGHACYRWRGPRGVWDNTKFDKDHMSHLDESLVWQGHRW